MTTTGKSILNRLYARTVAGTPVTSEDLASLGVSADLAVHYVRAGWLNRLARGVFVRQGEAPGLHPSLRLLERMDPRISRRRQNRIELAWSATLRCPAGDASLVRFDGGQAASLVCGAICGGVSRAS